MFSDSDNGQTQYCEECQKWAEKCEKMETELRVAKMNRLTIFEHLDIVEENKKLKAENERLKQGIKHYQRGMFKIISVATECRNSKQWNYDNKQV